MGYAKANHLRAQVYSILSDLKREGAAARCCRVQQALGIFANMGAQLETWKLAAERLWSAPAFDHRGAALLAAEIARGSEEPSLRQRAAQALPSLRAACAKGADRRSKDLAQRRFGAVRDCLHALTGPRFGKRGNAAKMLTIDEQHRRVLGLPLDRRLFGPEIHQAYKRMAKRVHPDAGGNERAFLELCAARDALVKAL